MPQELQAIESTQNPTATGQVGSLTDELSAQIAAHRKRDQERSMLGHVVGAATSMFWSGDSKSMHTLETLQSTGAAPNVVAEAIKKDRAQVDTKDEITRYGTGFVKTAALFCQGPWATAAYAGLSGLDQARPGETLGHTMTDFALGSAKGGLLKYSFSHVSKMGLGVPGTAVGLGMASQFLDSALSRQTYLNENGNVDMALGGKRVLAGTFEPKGLITNAIIFGAAQGAFKGIDALSAGAIARSPFLTTVATGATFGVSTGALGEIAREQSAHEKFDLAKVMRHGLIQGTLDGVAAMGGGLQADPQLRAELKPKLQHLRDTISLARWDLAGNFWWSPIPLVLTAPADRAADLAEEGQFDRAMRLADGHFKAVIKHKGHLNLTSEHRADWLASRLEEGGRVDDAAHVRQIIIDDIVNESTENRNLSSWDEERMEKHVNWLSDHGKPEAAKANFDKLVQIQRLDDARFVEKYEKDYPQGKSPLLAQNLDLYSLWLKGHGYEQQAKDIHAEADNIWTANKGMRSEYPKFRWLDPGTPESPIARGMKELIGKYFPAQAQRESSDD